MRRVGPDAARRSAADALTQGAVAAPGSRTPSAPPRPVLVGAGDDPPPARLGRPRAPRRRGPSSTSSAVSSTLGVLRSAGALGEVGGVVADQQERAARPQGREAAAHGLATLRPPAAGGRRSRPGRRRRSGTRSSRRRRPTRRSTSPARVRPLSSATCEKSTAVTSQPRLASQIALRPSPAARSSARPGGRSAHSASTNWFGPTDQTRSLAAYRSSQAFASTPVIEANRPSRWRAGASVHRRGRDASSAGCPMGARCTGSSWAPPPAPSST